MLLEKLKQSPIVPVYYNDNISDCQSVMSKCYEGGVRVFEFVDRGVKSEDNFEKLLNFRNQYFKDLILGVGTVKNETQAEKFVRLGADFLVSPIVYSAIAEVAQANNVEWIPGCMTPTEIAQAERLGVSIVKLFPGDILGPNFIKAIKPLFPSLRFMVTGGVSLSKDNLKAWFDAGASSVGVGSKLFNGEFVSESSDVVGNLKESLLFIHSL